MKNLKTILKELELFLTNLDAPILDSLRLGLNNDQINVLISGLDLFFKDEIYDLYAWRNGTKDTEKKLIGEMTLFTNGIFYSLEESIDAYSFNAIENSHWDKNYFPLFSSGGGDYLLINIEEGQSQRAISLYSPALLYSNELVTVYDSLETLFLSVLQCYQQKAYYFEKRMLKRDVDLEFDICTKNNPKSQYWKDV